MDDNPPSRLGTVICTDVDPNVMEFNFVVEGGPNEIITRRGEFVGVTTENGIVIGRVQDLVRTNRYYQHAEAVREYQSRGDSLRSIFPTDRWQYTVARVRVSGLWANGKTVRPYFAVAPGSIVRRVDEATLASFLRLDLENGLKLGRLGHHGLDFMPTVERLLSKHLAILAMSGAGKSYFVSVLLEELLARKKEQGRLAIVLIDVHGEYAYLKDMTPASLDLPPGTFHVEYIRGPQFQIPVQSLTADSLGAFVSDMSAVQVRDLRRVIAGMHESHRSGYTLSEIVEQIRADETMTRNTKEALISWLVSLDDTGLFGRAAAPDLKSLVRPGTLFLVDLSDFISLRKKQIIVSYLASELLGLRRQGRIPPFLLILEEAHQFCPEGRHEMALPKSQIETIAREGRKFFALLCLVSQRPVRLSTTVLSQCSNQAIFRTTNPYDLDHIGRTSEGIDKSSLDAITTLEVGEALFVGECVSVPTFVKIRRRSYEPERAADGLEAALKRADQ